MNAYRGKHRVEERAEREEWERVRWLASVSLAPHAKKGHSIKPGDLLPFPWEKKRRVRTKEEKLAALKRL